MGARQITVSGRLPEPYRQQFGSACGNRPQTAAKSIIASLARMSTDSDHVSIENHELISKFRPRKHPAFLLRKRTSKLYPHLIISVTFDTLLLQISADAI